MLLKRRLCDAFYDHMTTFNLHISILPCRILAGILSAVILQSCDTVVEATMPVSSSGIPQASTEVFKQKYPGVTLQGPNDRDKTVVAIANVNAGLGNNMNSGPFPTYVSNGKGYANDLIAKNMV